MSARTRTFETTFRRFKAVKQIGSGGSGNVWHVRDADGQEFALKLLNEGSARQAAKLVRFERELRFGLTACHENIVEVLDHGYITTKDLPKQPFYVMRLYPRTLRQVLDSNNSAPDVILSILNKVLAGLEHAHSRGVTHRDLKPENVLCGPAGEVVLADFGCAHFAEEELSLTRAGERLANFEYAAPEQRMKGAKIDHRADIFAFGCILNSALTGVVPHGADYTKIGSVLPEYAYLDGVVEQLIKQDPGKRPSSIAQVRQLMTDLRQHAISAEKAAALAREEVTPSPRAEWRPHSSPGVIGYRGNQLQFQLDREPDQQWVAFFSRPRGSSGPYPMGSGPQDYLFFRNTVSVRADERTAAMVRDNFERLMRQANDQYAAWLEASRREAERQRQAEHQQRVQEAELAERVLRALNQSRS